jgi:thymidine kinase
MNNPTIELHLVMGPMFAGKTTHLINKVNELVQNGVLMDEILLVNHSSDSRYDNNKICSHNGCKIDSESLTKLYQLDMNEANHCYTEKKYLFIDEAQFFTDLYDTVLDIMKLRRTIKKSLAIWIFGLDGDFQQKPFQNYSRLLELIPYASSITKLLAKCYICNAPAPFSKRLIKSNLQILVGDNNIYQPSCYYHLLLDTNSSNASLL